MSWIFFVLNMYMDITRWEHPSNPHTLRSFAMLSTHHLRLAISSNQTGGLWSLVAALAADRDDGETFEGLRSAGGTTARLVQDMGRASQLHLASVRLIEVG